jgi:hypothetical protein
MDFRIQSASSFRANDAYYKCRCVISCRHHDVLRFDQLRWLRLPPLLDVFNRHIRAFKLFLSSLGLVLLLLYSRAEGRPFNPITHALFFGRGGVCID